LRSLSLSGTLLHEPSTAQTLVGHLENLEEFTLDQLVIENATFPEELARAAPWPKLKKLTLKLRGVPLAAKEFIESFGSSLVELVLETPADDELTPSVTPLLVGSSFFLVLRSISVIGASDVANSIFSRTSRDDFPSLSFVRLSYNDNARHGFGEEDGVLAKLFAKHRFRSLQYNPPDQDITFRNRNFLRERAAALNFRLDLSDCPELAFPHLGDVKPADEVVRASVHAYLLAESYHDQDPDSVGERFAKVLEYLAESIAHAKITGNTVELTRILLQLRPFEFDRLAKFD
jgi:hypothetical protein